MTTAALTLQAARSGRFGARILGGLFALFFLFFVFGEGVPPVSLSQLGLACLICGLIAALFWEGLGGLVAILGWLLFTIGNHGHLNLFVSLAAAVALVHTLSWLRLRAAPAESRSSPVPAVFWIALAVFVLLCANEALGNPPLLTPSAAPPAGAWSSPDVSITIAPDGSVTGTVGAARIASAELIANRTWFGRLMRWRTDYMIRGSLIEPAQLGAATGNRFTAPVNLRDSELDGSISLSNPGPPLPARLTLRRQVAQASRPGLMSLAAHRMSRKSLWGQGFGPAAGLSPGADLPNILYYRGFQPCAGLCSRWLEPSVGACAKTIN